MYITCIKKNAHTDKCFTEVTIMDKSKIKKIVLAYSGGLDTSIIIPWLK